MRIAIDARFYGTENGGLGRYTMSLLSEIEKADKKNTYILLLREKYYKTLNISENFEKVLVNSRHYSFSEQFELLRVLKKIQPDMVHFLHFNVPLFYNKPYIVTIHDLLMHTGVGKEATTLPRWKYLLKRIGYRTIFDHSVNKSKHIITPSQFVKKQIINTYNLSDKRISVVYEGVSLMQSKYALKPESYFLYVGNAYPHKNIQTLLRSLALLNEKSQKMYKLILVTPRDVFTTRLKNQINDLNVSKFVEIENGVNDLQLKNLYSKAIAFVYPSFSEGFGLPGLEAMQCKTRLVASDIEVFREVYKSNAQYFDPNSSEELALTLQKIIDEKSEDRDRKISEADSFAKKYSWQKMARATLAIYEKS